MENGPDAVIVVVIVFPPAGEECAVEEMVRPADAAQRRPGQTHHLRMCECRVGKGTVRPNYVIRITELKLSTLKHWSQPWLSPSQWLMGQICDRFYWRGLKSY